MTRHFSAFSKSIFAALRQSIALSLILSFLLPSVAQALPGEADQDTHLYASAHVRGQIASEVLSFDPNEKRIMNSSGCQIEAPHNFPWDRAPSQIQKYLAACALRLTDDRLDVFVRGVGGGNDNSSQSGGGGGDYNDYSYDSYTPAPSAPLRDDRPTFMQTSAPTISDVVDNASSFTPQCFVADSYQAPSSYESSVVSSFMNDCSNQAAAISGYDRVDAPNLQAEQAWLESVTTPVVSVAPLSAPISVPSPVLETKAEEPARVRVSSSQTLSYDPTAPWPEVWKEMGLVCHQPTLFEHTPELEQAIAHLQHNLHVREESERAGSSSLGYDVVSTIARLNEPLSVAFDTASQDIGEVIPQVVKDYAQDYARLAGNIFREACKSLLIEIAKSQCHNAPNDASQRICRQQAEHFPSEVKQYLTEALTQATSVTLKPGLEMIFGWIDQNAPNAEQARKDKENLLGLLEKGAQAGLALLPSTKLLSGTASRLVSGLLSQPVRNFEIQLSENVFYQASYNLPAYAKPLHNQVIGMTWGQSIQAQGGPFEDTIVALYIMPENRTPAGYPVLDGHDKTTGIASSVKTLDTLTPARIAKPAQVYYTLKRHTDKLADFKGKDFSERDITQEMIEKRDLYVGVPAESKPEHWDQIQRGIDYAKERGVHMEIFAIIPKK